MDKYIRKPLPRHEQATITFRGVTYRWTAGTDMGTLNVNAGEGSGSSVTIPAPVIRWLYDVLSGFPGVNDG